MTDDANAPTVPDTQAPTHGSTSASLPPKAPDSRYELRRQLGRGGMGEVWLAHDTRVDRDIAIKVMRSGQGDPDLVARFLREARVQGRLEHPCVVPVHDLGAVDLTAPFFAMKRLTGTTLADVIAARDDKKWPRRTLLARFVDVCLAIEFAHQAGVVHRDLKPANIMLGDFGEAYVLDWGVARLVGDSDVTRAAISGEHAGGHTEVGAVLGTPGYMSPEQLRGDEVDARTDVYALGCILFEILVGSAANARQSAIASTLSTTEHRPLAVAPDVPPELDEVCAQATQADRAQRLGSARALADAVQGFLDGDRDLTRRRELAAEHVTRAEALAARGDAGRADAIREAGSAIALDPENAAAKQLVARLLLEPPEKIPPEAQRAIDAERRVAEVAVLKAAVVAYIMFFIAMPGVWLLGVSEVWPLFLLGAEVVVAMLICIAGTRGDKLLTVPGAISILLVHCVMLATMGVLLGPLLVTPILIFGSATIMFVSSAVRVPKMILFIHVMVLAIPLALELSGLVPRTFALEAGALVLRPWAVELAPSAMMAAVLGTVMLQLIGNMIILDRLRGTQESAVQRIHLNAWQLQQLVPSSGSPR